MQQELKSINQDIRALARQHNWSELLEMAGRREPMSVRVLVAAPAESDSSDFRGWVKETFAGTILFEPLSTLASQPELALAFERVIIVFTCGVLIKGDEVALVKTTLLNRPAGSYALVMRGAGHIQSAEDLAIIERGLRRLFLSYLMPDMSFQENIAPLLQEHNMLLWDTSTENVKLVERLEQEKKLLTYWLEEDVPTTTQTSLEIRSIQELLREANLRLVEAQEEYQRSQPSTEQIHTFQAALSEIQLLRKKLHQLMETRIQLITIQVKTSLESVQVDLLRNPPLEIRQPFLAHHQGSLDLAPSIREGLRHWHQEREKALFEETEKTTLSNLQSLVQDKQPLWERINGELREQGRSEIYPGELLNILQKRTIQTLKIMNQTPLHFTYNTTRQGGWALRTRLLNWLVALRFPVRLLNFFDPAQSRYNHRQLEQAWQKAVNDVMEQTIHQVTENVQRYGSESQEALDKALAEIERLLEARVGVLTQARSVPNPYIDTAKTLQSCRQRLNDFLQKNILISK